jgi:hypothetical protein
MLGSTPGPMTSGDQLSRVEAKTDQILKQNRTLTILTIIVVLVLLVLIVLIFV